MFDKIVKYGLRLVKNGEFVSFSAISASLDGGSSVAFFLESYLDNMIWMVDSEEKAEFVRLNSSPWYNADYDTPRHKFKPHELEVVKIELVFSLEKTK